MDKKAAASSPEEETQPKIADYSISEKWQLLKDLIFFSPLLNAILAKFGWNMKLFCCEVVERALPDRVAQGPPVWTPQKKKKKEKKSEKKKEKVRLKRQSVFPDF